MDGRRSQRATAAAVAFGLLFGGGLAPTPAQAQTQTRSRDVTITGPRGRTVERQLQSTVGPGGIDRRMTVTRPGGSMTRELQATRPAMPMPMPRPMPGPPRGGMGAMGGPPRNVFIERNVFVNGGGGRGGISGAEAFGLGALGAAVGAGAGVLVGKALSSPPPPPVVVAGPPVVVAPAPLVAGPPVVVAESPAVVYQPVAPAMPDEVSQAITRLGSWHENSRKQAAYVLGRLGDPRAVPALVDVLRNDRSANVRIAAVNAIAQIGDPSSAVYLERVSVYDKKDEVRDAALAALARMPREAPAPAPSQARSQPAPTSGTTGWSTPSGRSQPVELEPAEAVPPPPTPIGARPTSGRRF